MNVSFFDTSCTIPVKRIAMVVFIYLVEVESTFSLVEQLPGTVTINGSPLSVHEIFLQSCKCFTKVCVLMLS